MAQDEALPRRRWADPRPELDQSWPRAPVYDRALSARVRRGHADQAPLLPKWPQHYSRTPSLNIWVQVGKHFQGWGFGVIRLHGVVVKRDDHVGKKDEQGLMSARLAKT